MSALVVPGLARQTPYIGPHGNVSCISKKYTVDAAQNDTLDMLIIPKGAEVVDAILIHGAAGASVTCDVGIAAVNAGTKGDDDCLMVAADIAAAGIKRRTAVINTDSALTLDDDDYYARLTLEAANPASITYELFIFYRFAGLK